MIILKNILSQTGSRTILEINTAPGACLLYAPGAVLISNMVLEHIWNQHCSRSMFVIYAPGAVLNSNMVLEHIWLRIFFKIINGPGPYGPGPYGKGPYYWAKIAQKPSAEVGKNKTKWQQQKQQQQQNAFGVRSSNLSQALRHGIFCLALRACFLCEKIKFQYNILDGCSCIHFVPGVGLWKTGTFTITLLSMLCTC